MLLPNINEINVPITMNGPNGIWLLRFFSFVRIRNKPVKPPEKMVISRASTDSLNPRNGSLTLN
jgi:hypothetical protein